ncbi:hypothetical protein ACOME3_006602 [Neoechinorhynchus agilis]
MAYTVAGLVSSFLLILALTIAKMKYSMTQTRQERINEIPRKITPKKRTALSSHRTSKTLPVVIPMENRIRLKDVIDNGKVLSPGAIVQVGCEPDDFITLNALDIEQMESMGETERFEYLYDLMSTQFQ